jgi:hypothetical protein
MAKRAKYGRWIRTAERLIGFKNERQQLHEIGMALRIAAREGYNRAQREIGPRAGRKT